MLLVDLALLAGSLVALRVVAAGARRLAPVPYTVLQQALVRSLVRFVAPLLVVAMIAPVAIVAVARPEDARGARFVAALASVGLAVMLTSITALVSFPLEREIVRWSPKGPPANWYHVRDRWEQVHTLRAVLGVVLLACGACAVAW